MGEDKDSALGCTFNGSLRIEGRPERLTADAGVIALRELDERLSLTEGLASRLADPRWPILVTHPLVELLRSRLYLMAQGHGSQDASDKMRDDPACRMAVSKRRGTSPLISPEDPFVPDGLASQPTQSRLLTILSCEANLATLHEALLEFAHRSILAERGELLEDVTLDIDSFALEVHGHQRGSAYNGHYRTTCYHPLVALLGDTGHWVGTQLRSGNVHTAAGAKDFILPLIDRVEEKIAHVACVRGDAGFPEDGLLGALEERQIGYAFRLRTNPVLEAMAAPYLRRPVGRRTKEPRTWTFELSYGAKEWSQARRVVLVVQEREDELYLHHFFLVTSWSKERMSGGETLDFYRERGTMEGHLGEHLSVLEPALSSTNRTKSYLRRGPIGKRAHPIDPVVANTATLLLYALAYNLAHSLRRLAGTPEAERPGIHLGRVRDEILRVPARLTLSARIVTLILGKQTKDRWDRLWKRLRQLRPLPAAP